MKLKIGDKVKKNPETWIKNDFDSLGRGEGIGEVVEPPFELEDYDVDVRWSEGRFFEKVSGLLKAE